MKKHKKKAKKMKIPHGKLRVIPLGGLEETGKNCFVIEYDDDIVVIDLGLMFPYENMPGIDYVIPDTTYLKKNRSKIRGIIITHGHLDHTGALPYLLEKLGNPPIYGTKLTIALIRERLSEFRLAQYARLHTFNSEDIITLGCFKISFFRVNHNIPDGVGVAVETPVGTVVHCGDFKFDHTPIDQKPIESAKIAELGNKGVLLAISDSQNVEKEGYAISEKIIGENMNNLFDNATGRIVVSTFASLISRIQQVVNASVAHGRKIAVSGLSMEKNVRIALELGYLKIPKNYFIRTKDIHNYPENKVTILSTGSQGQENSALGRMSRGEHRQIKIQKGDTIILSSSPIPGNERAIQSLMSGLFRLGANVIYKKIFDIHVSGHGYQEDLKLMLNLLKPKYLIPTHGEYYMCVKHSILAQELGIPEKNIFVLNNGEIIELTKNSAKKLSTRLPSNYVMVDGLGVGDIGNVVLRDRQVMAQDGMFVIIVKVDNETRKLVGEPDIISRGFVYMKSSEQLISETKQKVKDIFNTCKRTADWSPIRSKLRDDIGQFLFNKTQRRPMVLPVVIEV